MQASLRSRCPRAGRGAGGGAGGRRITSRPPSALNFHSPPAFPSPSRPSSAPDPLSPSPRGGDRRACNLVPFARLEQHLPPSPGTRGSHPKPYKKPETNPSPHANRTRRRGAACSRRQLAAPQVQTSKYHQKLSLSSFHLKQASKQIAELLLIVDIISSLRHTARYKRSVW